MPSHSIQITFSNNVDTYYAGQIVSGTVMLNTSEPKELNCITLEMKGECLVKWRTSKSHGGHNRQSVTHTQTDTYFKENFVLWGTGSPKVLEPGRYTYNFTYKLPFAIPSSFEGSYGYVRYTCCVKADKSAYFSFNWVEKRPFSVISLLDLNAYPQLMESECMEKNKSVGFIFNRGNIRCQWTLQKRGFVCGEKIPIILRIINESNLELKDLHVSLTQKVVYHANGHIKQQKSTISSDSFLMDCKPMSNDEFGNVTIIIPPVPPSELVYCNLINICYKIKVVVGVPGFHTNIKLKSEVTIGSVPFRSNFGSFNTTSPPLPSAPSIEKHGDGSLHAFLQPDSAMLVPSAPSFPLDNYAEMPPPSYMEAMMMNQEDLVEDGGDEIHQPFAPRYPVFDYKDLKCPEAPPPPYPGQ